MKIVFFDYWTKGIHNFILLNKELKKRGYETQLFHIGSFREKVEKRENIEGIDCVDISYYGTNLIAKALKNIKPDIVVTLNTTYLLDRAVVLACRKLGIKTIFLMHGTRATGDNLNKAIATAEKSYNSIWKKLKKSVKYFKIIIPNYVYSLYLVDKKKVLSGHFLKVIYSYFKNPGRSMYQPSFSSELIHDKCLIYANEYKKYYISLGYKEEQIYVVGNPKQDQLLSKIENNSFDKKVLPDQIVKLIDSNKGYAVYLEDSFVESGNMYGWDNEYRNRHLTEIAERLKNKGVLLVIKLHPTTVADNIKVTSTNAIVIENCELDELIYFSVFCIAHISTTVTIPILLNKPILVPKWDRSKNVIDYYTKNEVANRWDSCDNEFSLDINESARQEFIKEYITVTKPVALENIIKEIIE